MNNFQIWPNLKSEQYSNLNKNKKNEKRKKNTKKTSHNGLNVQAYKFPKKTFPWRMIIGPVHETYHVSALD
jgi:hypothetical protein